MGDQVFRRVRPVISRNEKNVYLRCIDRVMRIHRRVIIMSGEEHEHGLEDAVISPMALQGFCDRLEYCDDYISKAAMAIDYIANFHPFVEGNKRTAFEVAVALLRNGGRILDDDERTFRFIKSVASGEIETGEIEDWLRRNTRLSTS